MSVVVFQTSVAPFVQQVAQAFAEAGQLEQFYTTIYSLADSAAARRVVRDVPPDRITGLAWREWVRLAAGRLDPSGRLVDTVWEWSEKAFARQVASRLRPGLTGVYGYEFGARAAFERAREMNIRTIYDTPAPESEFVHRLLEAELARFPELETAHARFTRAKEPQRTAHRQAEWELADRVIVASNFTRQSYVDAGRDVAKVRVVPYGAPEPIARDLALSPTRQSRAPKSKFIWAGTFGVRKGAHYLLEAWQRGGFGRHAQLDIFGSVALPARAASLLPDGITIHGPVPHEKIVEKMREADALIFPTLCDGFGMVATEAWSQGTPVITTTRAGVADLLRDGENGLLIEAASSDAIEAALHRCIDHPARWRSMREASLQTAAQWQWCDYRRAIVSAVK